MKDQLPEEVSQTCRRYLDAADLVLPGAVTQVAVGGSVALGAYRPGVSDIDVVATIDDAWRERASLLARLRALHLSQLPRLLRRARPGARLNAHCDTSFIWESDVTLPVTQIVPIASHVGKVFHASEAFDVNPVTWHQLVHGGVSVRGADVTAWGLDAEPHELTAWTRRNLLAYWKPLLYRTEQRRGRFTAADVEWCLLGPARMHATLHTGRVISKEESGVRALNLFPSHAAILRVALASLRVDTHPAVPLPQEWRQLTIRCMHDILHDAGIDCR